MPGPLPPIDVVTRALSPTEFGGPNPNTSPTDVTKEGTATADAKRFATILAELKAARPKLESNDPKVVQDGWRHISLQVGYFLGLMEARGATIPVNTTLAEPANTKTAVDELIRLLETTIDTPTRILPIFFYAGIAAGILICRGCS
jgi:hypothetical protein